MNSSYNKIFKHVNGKKTKEDLIPILEIFDSLEEDKEVHITNFINETGLEWEHFYYNKDAIKPYVYYNPPHYYAFMGLDGSMDEMFKHEREGFSITLKEIDKVLSEKNYSMYFYYVEGPYDLLLFNELFDSLEGQDKYDVLVDLYVSSEYGHSQITRDMWVTAIKERTSATNKELPTDDEVLTIYRGEASESTDVTEAMSWSLSPSVASRFLGYSMGIDSKLYQAKINRSDIIDYLDSRSEAEIVCFPEDIFDVVEIDQIHPVEFYQELENNRIADEFVYYRNSVLDKVEGFNQGVHEKKHSVRVLLLSLALGELLGVSDRDRAILANVAIYHDSVRDNDGVDTIHGKKAVEKMEMNSDSLLSITCKDVDNEYELDFLSEEEEDIVKFIVQWHCVDDEQVKGHLDELGDNKRTEKLFYLFKDADALDRVRIRDLDVNYLRNEVSTKLIGFAHFLHSSIK